MKNMYGRILLIEWTSVGWIFALLSGFIVTTAYEISELVKVGKKVTAPFAIQKGCALVVAFSLGYLLKVHIQKNITSEDIQAGVYALVGAVGFSLYGIVYRIITNKKAWETIFFTLIRARLDLPKADSEKFKIENDAI